MLTADQLVSCVIPVFNHESTVVTALSSICLQSHEHIEIIVVDDGSSDNSVEAIKSMEDPRIRLIELGQNCGISTALNTGISESNGAFIARMDADDFSFAHRFSTQLDYFARYPELGVLGSQVHWENGNTNEALFPTRGEDFRAEFFFRNPIAHPSVMFRREVLSEERGPYNTNLRFAQDFELWSRLLVRTEIYSTSETLVRLGSPKKVDPAKAINQQIVGSAERRKVCKKLGIEAVPSFENVIHLIGWLVKFAGVLSRKRITSRRALSRAAWDSFAAWLIRNASVRSGMGSGNVGTGMNFRSNLKNRHQLK